MDLGQLLEDLDKLTQEIGNSNDAAQIAEIFRLSRSNQELVAEKSNEANAAINGWTEAITAAQRLSDFSAFERAHAEQIQILQQELAKINEQENNQQQNSIAIENERQRLEQLILNEQNNIELFKQEALSQQSQIIDKELKLYEELTGVRFSDINDNNVKGIIQSRYMDPNRPIDAIRFQYARPLDGFTKQSVDEMWKQIAEANRS